MKKLGILLLTLCLFGCQRLGEVYQLEESKSYTIQEQLEFEFIKANVVSIIEPSNKNNTYKYLKPSEDGNVFVDVILKTTSLAGSQKLEDIYKGTMECNQQKYDLKMIVESPNYNQLSTTDTLKEYEARYIHLYCEVPQNEVKGNIKIAFDVLSQKKFEYTFQVEDTVIPNNEKSLGDVLELHQSQIAFNAVQQTKKIEPSHKGFFYSYIPTDKEDEIFVVLQLDIKNITDTSIQPSEYIYCEYLYGEEVSPARLIMESENHEKLLKSGVIEPSQTRTLYLAMPILEKDVDVEGKIILFVEGNTYRITNTKE